MRIERLNLGLNNAYYLEDEKTGEAVLVDCGLESQFDRIIKRLNEISVDVRRIQWLYITHAHTDHFGSAQRLKKEYGMKVASSRGAAASMETGSQGQTIPATFLGRVFNSFAKKGRCTPVMVDLIIEDGDELKAGLHAKATPGHTKDCMSFCTGEKCVVGDLIMPAFGTMPFYAISREAILESLIRLKDSGIKSLLPGHGREVSIEFAVEKIVRS